MNTQQVDPSFSLNKAARRVQAAVENRGLLKQVVELPGSTLTAQDAARSIVYSVGQMAKSLVFQVRDTGRPLLVIASGTNRVDEKWMARQVGEKVRIADADFVRQHTGFAIGGLPLAHIEPMQVLIDRDLRQFDEIWAAAGTPHAVFKLNWDDLVAATKGKVISLNGPQ